MSSPTLPPVRTVEVCPPPVTATFGVCTEALGTEKHAEQVTVSDEAQYFARAAARRWWRLPLVAIIVWWAICFGLYASKWPIAYLHVNFGEVITIVTGALAASGIAYALSYKASFGSTFARLPQRPTLVPILGVTILVILFIPTVQAYSGYGVSQLGAALQNQSSAYQLGTDRISEGIGSRGSLVVVSTLVAPLTLTSLPYFALTWFEERRHLLAFFVSVALPVLTAILVGRSQQLGVAGISILGSWLVSRCRRRKGFGARNVMVGAGLAVLMALGFAVSKVGRTSGELPCPPGSATCLGVDPNPSIWHTTTTIIASYASQGFEGLGRAFNGTWVSGGGYTHSPALTNFIDPSITSQPDLPITYQLDQLDWSSTGYWSTAFANIANDVPWVLVPLVIAAFGWLLGTSWRSASLRGDWLSVSVFVYTWLSLLYVPQNLQIAGSGPLYVGYLVLVCCYLVRGARRVDSRWRRLVRAADAYTVTAV